MCSVAWRHTIGHNLITSAFFFFSSLGNRGGFKMRILGLSEKGRMSNQPKREEMVFLLDSLFGNVHAERAVPDLQPRGMMPRSLGAFRAVPGVPREGLAWAGGRHCPGAGSERLWGHCRRRMTV